MKRIISFALVGIIIFQLSACSTIQKTASTAKDVATNAKDTVVDWWSEIDFSFFERGWDSAAKYVGSAYAAAVGGDYIANISKSINKLKIDINSAKGSARGIQQEAGYVAEKWHADTFNIDAAANNSGNNAIAPHSNKLGSEDIITATGETASSKYYQSAKGSAKAQAQTFIKAYNKYANKSDQPLSFEDWMLTHGHEQEDAFSSIYEYQIRIIPADQLADAKAYLAKKIAELETKEGTKPSADLKSFRETLENLSDKLEASDGTESVPLSYEEANEIAKHAQEGDFSPEDFGIRIENYVTPKYVIKQAIGAGVSAATIQLLLEVGPDIFSIVKKSMETQKIDEESLKEMGIDGALAAGEGFVEGSVSYSLVTLCQAGKLGTALIDVSPEVVGALTVIVINSIRYGYELSKGNITAEDYGNLVAEDVIVAAGSIAAGSLVALLGGATIAHMAGCFAGGLIASAGFNITKEIVLDIKDGGGFELVVPQGAADTVSVARETICNLNIPETVSNFKDMVVSTASDGLICIKAVINQ